MRFYFGTNLKMNHTVAETDGLVAKVQAGLARLLPPAADMVLWIAPSYPAISAAAQRVADPRIWIGAQNVYWEERGAFTGEVSAAQLRSAGASFVMLGHAERRGLFGETDDMLARKVSACAQQQLRIMLCVGETARAKESGLGLEFIARQLSVALAGFNWQDHSPDNPGLIILYEPVWSIGAAGQAADPADVDNAMGGIRASLRQLGGDAGAAVPILYGGSVTAHNVGEYARLAECSGVGVGRAAWQPEDFLAVFRQCL